MTPEEFIKQQGAKIPDKIDAKKNIYNFNDLMQFAKSYHENEVKKLNNSDVIRVGCVAIEHNADIRRNGYCRACKSDYMV